MLSAPIPITPASQQAIKPVFPLQDVAKRATEADPAIAVKQAKARDVAEKFEAQFLSIMFQQMFEGVKTDGPFGGGTGEEMFRSLMTEAMAKQTAKSGGIGLADTIQRELLKMQEVQ
jgi:Rod binding domain-containing protein